MHFKRGLIFCALFFLFACKENTPTTVQNTNTTCASNAAIIQVYDGLLRTACGCAEGVQVVSSGTNINCTVNTNTEVFFQTVSITVTHQFEFQGFGVGPVWNPATDTIQSYSIRPTSTGSYIFSDRFVPGLSGTVIAI